MDKKAEKKAKGAVPDKAKLTRGRKKGPSPEGSEAKRAKDARKQKMLEALASSRGIIHPACEVAGIARCTFHRWMNEDAEFASAVDALREIQVDHVESALMNKIDEGDVTSIIFYLKTRGRSRGYSERTEVTGAGGRDLIPSIRVEIVDADDDKGE